MTLILVLVSRPRLTLIGRIRCVGPRLLQYQKVDPLVPLHLHLYDLIQLILHFL